VHELEHLELVAGVERLRRLHFAVHGGAGAVRELRYWRSGDTEDRWQATKREWNAAIEAEEAVMGA